MERLAHVWCVFGLLFGLAVYLPEVKGFSGSGSGGGGDSAETCTGPPPGSLEALDTTTTPIFAEIRCYLTCIMKVNNYQYSNKN